MATIKSYQEQVQDIVEKAIAAVEEQHKALASASFSYAEKYAKVDTVKSKHDEVADLAYGKAREVNKLVNDYAGDLILKFEKPAPAKKKATAKKAPAKKAVAKKAPAKKAPAKKETAAA